MSLLVMVILDAPIVLMLLLLTAPDAAVGSMTVMGGGGLWRW